MEKNNVNNKIYFTVFLMLLLINTIDRTNLETSVDVAKVSLYGTFILMYFYLLKTWLHSAEPSQHFRFIYIVSFLLMFYISYSFINTEYMEINGYVTLLMHLLFIISVVKVYFTMDEVKVAGYFFTSVTVAFFIDWAINGFPLSVFSSVFTNENYLGVLLFSMLYFQMLAAYYSERIERSIFRIGIMINVLLIFTTGARSVVIGLLLIVLTALCIKFYPRMLNKLIYIVLAMSFLFVGFYVSLSFTTFGSKLNELSYEWTGKNLFSGRQEIWSAVFQKMMDHPILGHGLGVRAHEVAAVDTTAHNMYLQLLLELGFAGFALFIGLIIVIWKMLQKQLNTFASKCSLCFMSGILMYNTFELTMMQNNYSIAVFQWLIMAFGIGFIETPEKTEMDGQYENRYCRKLWK